MTPENLQAKFQNLSDKAAAMREELERLQPLLARGRTGEVDRLAIMTIISDLGLAVAGLKTVGDHQVGKDLDNCMGFNRGFGSPE